MGNGLSDIQPFIHGCIDSVEQLHVLLYLHGNPERAWTFDEISRELRSSPGSIAKRARDLVDRRVLAPSAIQGEAISYLPHSAETARMVSALAEQYRVRQYKVIEMIFDKPPSAIQSFADAFRIKKEEDNE